MIATICEKRNVSATQYLDNKDGTVLYSRLLFSEILSVVRTQ